ncbi:hypothetical protein OFN61_28270, partial [Escherichia coli]|nr:hypothetical protein [Escherichia coli]
MANYERLLIITTEQSNMTSAFFIPTVNLMGAGCLKDAANSIQSQGFKKGLIVTDKILNQIGVVKQVQDLLTERDVATVV